jgi:hypothetical protein
MFFNFIFSFHLFAGSCFIFYRKGTTIRVQFTVYVLGFRVLKKSQLMFKDQV